MPAAHPALHNKKGKNMSYKMSNEKNQELQEKASRDHENGERDVPYRNLADSIFLIPKECTDKWEDTYKKAWDDCDKGRK